MNNNLQDNESTNIIEEPIDIEDNEQIEEENIEYDENGMPIIIDEEEEAYLNEMRLLTIKSTQSFTSFEPQTPKKTNNIQKINSKKTLSLSQLNNLLDAKEEEKKPKAFISKRKEEKKKENGILSKPLEKPIKNNRVFNPRLVPFFKSEIWLNRNKLKLDPLDESNFPVTLSNCNTPNNKSKCNTPNLNRWNSFSIIDSLRSNDHSISLDP